MDVAQAGWAWGLSSKVPQTLRLRLYEQTCISWSPQLHPQRGTHVQGHTVHTGWGAGGQQPHPVPVNTDGQVASRGVSYGSQVCAHGPQRPAPPCGSPTLTVRVGTGTGGGSGCQFYSRCRWPDREPVPGLASPSTWMLSPSQR